MHLWYKEANLMEVWVWQNLDLQVIEVEGLIRQSPAKLSECCFFTFRHPKVTKPINPL